jgi:hypothetical protein
MRKIVAGALAAAALSWAGGIRAEDAAKERREAADATKAEAQQKAQEAREAAGARTSEAMGRQEEKKHPLFEGKSNFDLKGKIEQVSANSVTIQRDELPSATLHVSPNTKIEVDGKKVSTQELKRGQDVKASFNLSGDKVEAVEITAEQLKREDRREMGEQRRENQQKMNERARESQQK